MSFQWLARLAGRCGMVSALRRLPDGQQRHLPTLGPQRAGLNLEPPTSRAGSQLWAKPGLVQPGSNQAGTSSAPLPFLVFHKAYLHLFGNLYVTFVQRGRGYCYRTIAITLSAGTPVRWAKVQEMAQNTTNTAHQ